MINEEVQRRIASYYIEGGHAKLPPLPNMLPPFAKDVTTQCHEGYHKNAHRQTIVGGHR